MNVTPFEFLQALFEPHEKVCLRVFSDKPGSAFYGKKLECELEQFEEFTETLKRYNDEERGIYFVINYGGHDDADITRIKPFSYHHN